MDILKTSTGKIFQSDYIATIPYPAQAYIRIIGATLVEVASIFGDIVETADFWYNDIHFSKYTHLVAIVPEGDAVKVVLAKE